MILEVFCPREPVPIFVLFCMLSDAKVPEGYTSVMRSLEPRAYSIIC